MSTSGVPSKGHHPRLDVSPVFRIASILIILEPRQRLVHNACNTDLRIVTARCSLPTIRMIKAIFLSRFHPEKGPHASTSTILPKPDTSQVQ